MRVSERVSERMSQRMSSVNGDREVAEVRCENS